MASCTNYAYTTQDTDRSDESLSASSEGEYSDDSSSFTDEYEPAWIDKINSNGSLFYIEPYVNLADDSSSIPEHHELTIHEKTSELDDTKSSATSKLKKWMEHRKKKIKRKFSRKALKEKASTLPKEKSIPKVPDENRPNYDVRDIYFDVDLSRHNYGRRATVPEKLFGLVLSPGDSESCHNKVLVTDVTPEADNCKEKNIKIGDCIKSVDDNEVTWTNLENVLSSIQSPKRVKLTVQSGLTHDTSSSFSEEICLCDLQSFGQWLEGPGLMEKSMKKYAHLPYAVYYLSMGQESESKDHDDVTYCFPDQDGQLFKQRGMFVTLGHMMCNVATPPIRSCSMVIQDQIVHVGYAIEGQQFMVLCIPHVCANVDEVQHYVNSITKVLKLQFSCLSRAFSEPNYKDYLDHFFTMFFHWLFIPLFSEKNFVDCHLLNVLPSVHWLPLPPDLKIVVDDILSQLESADFGDTSDGYYDMQRIYNILGACLFYKGYLLGSHMNKEDLLDIHLFLKHHRLLALTKSQPIAQAVIWKEIFPSRKEFKNHVIDPDYIEADGRCFILVVALRFSIVATLLEAGGCALSANGSPSPEPFYVEQIENTLLSFEESGLYPAVNRIIMNQDPSLASPQKFLKAEKSNWELLSSIVNFNITFSGHQTSRLLSRRSQSYTSLPSEANRKTLESTSKKSFGVELERQQLLTNMGPADGESDAEANAASDDMPQKHRRSCSISNSSNTGSHDSDESFLFQRSTKRIYNSSYDLRSSLSSQDQNEHSGRDSPSWLVSGSENTLFYYLHMDPVEGVFLSPTDEVQKVFQGPFGVKVLKSFFSCCLNMRTTFERSLRNRELSLRTYSPKFGTNSFLQAVHEQGALFQCTAIDTTGQKKLPQVLDFWVIGRLFFAPEPREVYVCYQDSAEQDVVELAFRLGFGLSL